MTVLHHQTWAVILAAGSGSRLAPAIEGRAKQFLPWHGLPLYWHSALNMRRSCLVDGLVFVFPAARLSTEEAVVRSLAQEHDFALPWLAVAGGALRQDSVRLGLAALPKTVRHVLIHDAARPFATPGLIRRICETLAQGARAVIPGLPVTDTIKLVEAGQVKATLPREQLAAVQTPQGFELAGLRQAHAAAQESGLVVTDDAAMLESLGTEVRIIPGEAANVKITNPEDLALLQGNTQPRPCTGMGYDVHRYGAGRDMKLGGVPIPGGPQVVAHSDGDVLLHALMDAMLGCAGLGDIGQHFPDNDTALEGISSAVLLDQVQEMLHAAHVHICHVDMTIVAQSPRLAPYREEIRKNVARLLHLDKGQVNLKATTEEKMGFTGRAEGIKAYALVSALCHETQPPLPCRNEENA
ncbi:MAG: 2-C-methyl-D-erythritol 4-phosphate cytidylyltransferase [Desulfovibrionaceae bacterium]|nr:2-C-methyl-D-erythritol 4-phosphate cytidylyltransferase [Desulfovibrionaceae bacterium]